MKRLSFLAISILVASAAFASPSSNDKELVRRTLTEKTGVAYKGVFLEEIPVSAMDEALADATPQFKEKARDLQKSMQPGDKLVFFSTNPGSFKALEGRQGYAVVRGHSVPKVLYTVMN